MRSFLFPFVLVFGTGCTPYIVASTARTVPVGESRRTAIVYAVPGGIARHDSTSASMPGMDVEFRFGLDERSDLGIRVPSWSGAIATYKRRLDAPGAADGRATAVMAGAGLVNWGQHAHGEITLITSGDERGTVIPYGGLRVLQVVPLSTQAPHDSPTAGGFAGVRFGNGAMGLSLELGAYYDRSALKLRRGDFVLVPAVNVHGERIARLLHW
jgi:hypothetical protein